MKLKIVMVEDQQEQNSLHIERKQLEFNDQEKLDISYLVSLRSILKESSECFHKLKLLSSEDQFRITAQFTINNYISYLLAKHLDVMKESRGTI